MLETISVSTTKESKLTVGGYEYRIIYTMVNNVITLITCSVIVEQNGVLNEVGTIRKENGQVNSFIRDTEDYVLHIGQFKTIVEEVESEVSPIEG